MPKINLTQQYIKRQLECPSEKNRIEYCDTTFPGLYVEVRSTSQGQGTYYLRYKDKYGKTCHQKISRTYELSLAEARKRAQRLKAEILLGADPRAAAKQRKQVPTYSEFMLNQYLPYVKARKRSWRNDESMFRIHLMDAFGDFPLTKINREQVQSFHTGLKDHGLSPASCDHYIKLIRQALNLAVEWEIIEKNPVAKLKLFKADNKLERYMSAEQQANLLRVLDGDSNRAVALFVMFLLTTGARLNEGLTATWGNIDVEQRVWRIEASNSKSKKMRSVPLNSSALKIIAELRTISDEESLFINPKTKRRYTNINKTWKRLKTEAGLPHLRLHDLRHQFASQLVNAGHSLYEVQQILGHSDPTVTTRYAHLSSRTLQGAAESAALNLGDGQARIAQRL